MANRGFLLRHIGCTCSLESVHPTDIDPPERVLNKDCPVHGPDPDEAYEKWRDERDAEEREGYDDSHDYDE